MTKLKTSPVFKGKGIVNGSRRPQFFWYKGELLGQTLKNDGNAYLWLYAPTKYTFTRPYFGYSRHNAKGWIVGKYGYERGVMRLYLGYIPDSIRGEFCSAVIRLWATKVTDYTMSEDAVTEAKKLIRVLLVPNDMDDIEYVRVKSGSFIHECLPTFLRTRTIQNTFSSYEENNTHSRVTSTVSPHGTLADFETFKKYMTWVGARSYVKVGWFLIPGAAERFSEVNCKEYSRNLYETCGADNYSFCGTYVYNLCNQYTLDGRFIRSFLVKQGLLDLMVTRFTDSDFDAHYITDIDFPRVVLKHDDTLASKCEKAEDPVETTLEHRTNWILLTSTEAPLTVEQCTGAINVHYLLHASDSPDPVMEARLHEDEFKSVLLSVLLGSRSFDDYVADISEEDHRARLEHLCPSYGYKDRSYWSLELLECYAAFCLPEVYREFPPIAGSAKATRDNRVVLEEQQIERFSRVAGELYGADSHITSDGFINETGYFRYLLNTTSGSLYRSVQEIYASVIPRGKHEVDL